MEDLAQDLSLALHESSKELQQTVRRHNRKRKGKVRRNSNGIADADMSLYSVDFPNRSEASAGSDLDTILRSAHSNENHIIHTIPSHMKVIVPLVDATTDSEDQCSRIANKLSALTLPNNSSLVSGADLESDSVNELAAERKTTDHARRRRRAKLNASPSIVVGSAPDDRSFTPENERKIKPRPHGKKKESMETEPGGTLSSMYERKIKSQKMESEPSGYIPMLNADTGYYDMSSESSQLTSDGGETCDDQAGEADDEQSDWFHEVGGGTTYGIPIKSHRLKANEADDQTPTNHIRLHAGLIQHSIPHLSYPAKLKRTKYGKYGRPIRMGYRRLKNYAKSQQQSSSEQSQDCFINPSNISPSYTPDNKSPKRRRQLIQSNNNTPSTASYSGTQRPFSLQLPSNLSWSVGTENRFKLNHANPSILTNTLYRTSAASNSTVTRRRRRTTLTNNNVARKKKAGST